MNITFLIGSLKGGGAERVTCNLANYLAEKGHNVTILTIHEPEDRSHLNLSVDYQTLTRKRIPLTFIRALFKIACLGKYILLNKPDVYVPFLPQSCKCLFLYKRIIKCPIIITERSSPESLPIKAQQNRISFAQKADGAVWQTSSVSDWYNQHVKYPTCIIPNAINVEFLIEPNRHVRAKRIVAIGRLTKLKGFDLLIDAFALVANQLDEYTLEIYGEGNCRDELSRQIKSKGLSNRIKLLGFCDDIPRAIRDASLYISSSDYEGMPNSLMEAMALGLPCIATDCPSGGSRLLIQDGKNGLLVPVRKVENMAEAILKVLDDSQLAESLSQEAILVRDVLSADKIYGKWEKYICDVVEKYKRL